MNNEFLPTKCWSNQNCIYFPDHVGDPKGGFMSGGGSWSGVKIFFVIVLIIVGVIVCGAVGYVIFNKEDPTRRKRFY